MSFFEREKKVYSQLFFFKNEALFIDALGVKRRDEYYN